MKRKNEELQKMFCEMEETINVEELMEVKGGSEPIKCSIAGTIVCTGSGGVTCSSGVV